MAILLAAAAIPAACGGSSSSTPGSALDTSATSTATVPPVQTFHDSGVDAAQDSGPQAVDGSDGCSDGVKDNLETDVDCGGTVCPACADGKACVEPTDCVGKGCTDKVCITPTCTDHMLNGTETDVDCGGASCPKCTFGKKCGGGGDCSSNACNSSACGCPASMVIVPQAETLGGAYCIDPIEATNGQYELFLASNQPLPHSGVCADNVTYTPSSDWPPAVPLTTSYGFPVRYVDWCDAQAYCAWQNKQLCGSIGGGAIDASCLNVATSAEASANGCTAGTGTGSDAGSAQPLDAWYNACSAQGVNNYPYGGSAASASATDGFLPECTDSVPFSDGGANTVTAPSANATSNGDGTVNSIIQNSCQGGVVNLFEMSGNVAEWENACQTATTGSPDQDTCAVRGGSFHATAPEELRCKWDATQVAARLTTRDDIGIRCCVY